MTSSLLRVLIIVSLAVGVPAAHPRSPENCFCETWSVGNALGALGGSQNGATFRPGSSYTGGRTRSSAGNTCVSWMQVSFQPEISPCAPALALKPNPPLDGGHPMRWGILEETEKQQKAFHREIKLSQRIEGKGPDSPTPLSPRLASDAPSSTAILPLRRIGACPSTSSPRRTSSTMSSPSPFATIRSSAGAPRCLAPALRVTGSTVPGASSRATAPTPSPPHPGRRSTSATASASAPASGARRAASVRALRRGRRASSSTHPRQTPGCSSPTEGSNGARRCLRRPRRSAAIDASSAWTRSPSTGSSAGEPPVECASTLIRPEF